ncbi:MAG TPA: zinc ribbon domain-containing protein [Steroidobacteraceae bacterium]|nr:zinc ribbon domain-containing protein [Steroidobacteraceae bacterium]
MPIYEYQCEKCHHHLEALQKLSDKPLRECPECGKHSLKRLVSAPLFRLAGSGWYETDFKSDKETRRNLAGKDQAPAEGAKAAEDKTESKPEKAATPEKAEKKSVVTGPVVTGGGAKAKPKPVAKKPATKKSANRR